MQTYTVTGHWPFPKDMLRYDCARAATLADAALVEKLSHDFMDQSVRGTFTITLDSELSKYHLNNSAGRWASFGWTSSMDERFVMPPPPRPASETWPELANKAKCIAESVCLTINQDAPTIRTKEPCPYRAQALLELTIEELQRRV